MTDTEHAAVRLLWAKEGHGLAEPIPPDEEQRLLAKVRARAQAIEMESIKMLRSKLHDGRHYPRRHMQAALAFFVLSIGVGALVVYFVGLFR